MDRSRLRACLIKSEGEAPVETLVTSTVNRLSGFGKSAALNGIIRSHRDRPRGSTLIDS